MSDRYFKDRLGCHVVPAGKRPEDCGVDLRMAVEMPRLPLEHERFIAGRFVIDRVQEARSAERSAAQAVSWEQLVRRVARLEAELATIRERGE